MRSLTEALLYPGVGWLEATNLATGRGTDTPFERVGRPVDRSRSSSPRRSTTLGVPGTRFVPIWFAPERAPIQGRAVRRRPDPDHRLEYLRAP